jgi:hypothetical protein
MKNVISSFSAKSCVSDPVSRVLNNHDMCAFILMKKINIDFWIEALHQI